MKNKPLSHYARFFIEFQGYDFYDNVDRTMVFKHVLWAHHNYLCRVMTQSGKPVSRFRLIDRKGWKNGIRK